MLSAISGASLAPLRTTRSRSAVRAAATARVAPYFPGSTAPAHLDGSLPGDFGFDPWNLGEDKEQLKWYVQAELIHARFAMLGAAGVLVTDGATFAGLADFPKWTDQSRTYEFADSWTLFFTMMILFSFAEHKRLYDLKNPGSQGAPGSFLGLEAALGGSGSPGYPGKAFDPLNLAKDGPLGSFDSLKVKEIKNGRLAMLACAGFAGIAGSTGQMPHEALAAHIADPFHVTVATNAVAIPHFLG